MKTARVRFPYWVKLLLFGGVLALVPTMIVGMQALSSLEDTLKTDSRAYRAAVVSDIAEHIERILVASTNTLVGVSQTISNRTLEHTVRIEVARSFLEADDVLDHVIIWSYDGDVIEIISKDDAEYIAPETSLEETVRKESEEREVAFRADPGSQRVLSVVPIYREDKSVSGFSGSYVPITSVENKLRTTARLLPVSLDAVYLIDRQRTIISHPNADRIDKVLNENVLRRNLEKQITFDQEVTQSGEFVDDGGEPVVGSLKPLRFVDWAVVVETPVAEVYKSYRATRLLIGITLIGTLVVALLMAILFAKRLTSPIERLVDYSQRLAERDFDASTGVAQDDELGVLSDAMQKAAKDLKSSEAAIRHEIEIRSDLGRFLPKELVDGIVSREQELSLGGEHMEITVLFADVVSFTAMCEDHDPKIVVEVLNELFTILTEVVFKNRGTVDKFVGDSIMAFWGAPEPSSTHAKDALEAAEEMMRFVEFGNEKWKNDFDIKLELAIGVHSGVAIVGNVGSDTRMEYTAIGQTVNVAARMEALARPNQILTTETTITQVGDAYVFDPIGEEKINTRGDAITVYEVVQ